MKASVWVGNAPSWEVLDECLTFTFTEDGDAIPCRFAEAFGIDWFDDDYREASLSERPTWAVRDLLQRHSRGSEIADVLGNASFVSESCNAMVVLFEFDYLGLVESANLGDVSLRHLGTVDIADL